MTITLFQSEQKPLSSELLARIAASVQVGLTRPREYRDVERDVEAEISSKMCNRLVEADIKALAASGKVRARALRIARNGDLLLAAILLENSRTAIQAKQLSSEAWQCFQTFQLAAESYVQYKLDCFDIAAESLMESLACCERLVNSYGDVLSMRRIHLSANLVRLLATSQKYAEALHVCVNLCDYLSGNQEAWPLSPTAQCDDYPLRPENVELMIDQVLVELIRLMRPEMVVSNDDLVPLTRASDVLSLSTPVLGRSAMCISACIAYMTKMADSFVDHACSFLEAGPDPLRKSWREMERIAEGCPARFA